MNRIILISVLLISSHLLAQKAYKINTATWYYDAPINYIPKADNFKKEIKKGDEYLKKDENTIQKHDDVVVLALEKKDSTTNAIFVSYKNNSALQKHGLNGYAQLLKNLLVDNAKKEYPDKESSITIEEIVIDKVKFCVVRQSTFFKEKNYTGTKYFYISEIDNKEFMIVAININETDRKNAEASILNSTFK